MLNKIMVTITLIAGSTAFAKDTFPIEKIKSKCPELNDLPVGKPGSAARSCKVREFGNLGSIGEETLYYALYSFDLGDGKSHCEKKGIGMASAVWGGARKSGSASLVYTNFSIESMESACFEKPEWIQRGDDYIIALPGRFDQLHSESLNVAYLYQNDASELLDTDSWIKDIHWPEGMQTRTGLIPNLKTMTATAPLFRRQDADCCPSGGEMKVEFNLKGNALTVKKVSVSKGKK